MKVSTLPECWLTCRLHHDVDQLSGTDPKNPVVMAPARCTGREVLPAFAFKSAQCNITRFCRRSKEAVQRGIRQAVAHVRMCLRPIGAVGRGCSWVADDE